MYASAGIHPEEAGNISDIENEIFRIEKILPMKKVVAIGEIGLDYHYGKEYEEKQKELFDMQMALAAKTGLPVIIHDREAHGDVYDIVKKYEGKVIGVMHSYSVPYYYINSIIFCQYISVINFDGTEEGISLPRFEKLILYLVIMYIFLNYLLIVDKGAQKLYNI